MSVISRLKSNKQVASGLDRALKPENKVWLLFVQGKHQQRRYGSLYIEVIKRSNKQVIADLFLNKLQKLW